MTLRLQIDAVIERRRNVFYVSDLGPYLDEFQSAFRDQLDFFSFQKRGKWKLRDSPANRLSLRRLGLREYYDVSSASMVPL